jgi:hypothetical protein
MLVWICLPPTGSALMQELRKAAASLVRKLDCVLVSPVCSGVSAALAMCWDQDAFLDVARTPPAKALLTMASASRTA